MVIIYGIKEQLDPVKARLSNAIHASMCEVLGLPEGKRAHRFVPLQAEDFYYPDGRSEAYTVIEVNMIEGRAINTKKALIKSLFANIQDSAQLDPVDVEITIKEQPSHCWGFRGMTGDEAKLSYKVNI